MPYQSIYGSSGPSNARLTRTLGGKTNPFQGDFVPGRALALNKGKTFVPAAPSAAKAALNKANAASGPQHNTTKSFLSKALHQVEAFGQGVGTTVGKAIPELASQVIRAPSVARFAKPLLPGGVDRAIERNIVKPTRSASDKFMKSDVVKRATSPNKYDVATSKRAPTAEKVGKAVGTADVLLGETVAPTPKITSIVKGAQRGKQVKNLAGALGTVAKGGADTSARTARMGAGVVKQAGKPITDSSRLLPEAGHSLKTKISQLEKEKQAILKDPNSYSTNPEDIRSLAGEKVGRLNKQGTYAETRGATIASSKDSAQRLREIQREQKSLQVQMDNRVIPKATVKGAPKVDARAPTAPKGTPKQPATVVDYTKDKGAKWTKPFLSTTGLLSRHGVEGKQLADLVNKHAQTARDFSTKWFNQMPTFSKLKNKESTNFARAVQGKEAPKNARVAKAVDEWKNTSPQIRDAFIKHSGEDIGNIQNYFPRNVKPEYLKPDSKGFNAAVNHLVDSKQVKSSGEAVNALNQIRKSNVSGNVLGSFKFHRDFNLPEHMYDTSKTAIANYLEGAAHSVAGAKVLGLKKSGTFTKANDLIGKVAQRAGNAEEVKNTFEQAMGLKRYGEGMTKASDTARAVQVFTKLGLGAITNAGQTANTIIKNGFIDTAKGLGYLSTKSGRQYARETGAFTHGLINDLRQVQGIKGRAGKVGAPFFNNVEQFNRYLAASAGKFHAERLGRRVDKGGLGSGRAARDLQNLGVKGDLKGGLSKEQLLKAGRGSSDATQFVVAPHTLPGWANSPMGKLVAQFQTFSYKQTKFVNEEILKPLREGNTLPLVRLLAVMPIAYVGVQGAKNKIRGKDTSGDSNITKILDAWRAAGGGGTLESLATGAYNAKKYSKSSSDFVTNILGHELGPTAGTAVDTTKSAFDAASGNTKTAAKQGTGMIPVAGGTLKNKYFPAGSATEHHVKTQNPALEKELKAINYPVQDTVRTSGRTASLSNKDYSRYTAASSSLFSDRAKQALNDPSYKALPPDEKKKQMSTILSGARTDILNELLGKPKRSKTAKYKTYR